VSRQRRWRRRAAALVLGLCAAVSGCSYGAEEPGLFAPRPTNQETPSRPLPPRARAGVLLPVAGDAVWTLRVRSPLQIRVAVHAVRRVDGGTVLDWSLTPLANETTPIGSRLPAAVVKGLGSTEVSLIDPGRRTRLAALADGTTGRCLCTRLDPAVARLRAGGTSLLQTAFPSLPETVQAVGVAVPLVPTFAEVPVTPIGRLPRAKAPTDLARPADQAPGQARSPVFHYPPARQQFLVELGPVVTSDSFTSISWRVRALTAGSGPAVHLPVPAARRARDPDAGPSRASPTGPNDQEPVALDGSGSGRVDGWAQLLRRPGDQIELVTTVAPTGPGNADTVDVVLPGLTTVRGVATTRAVPAATRDALTQAYPVSRWPDQMPPAPLAVSDWPTPVPGPRMLAAAAVSHYRI
jgi:hypothetical protein